MRSRRVLLLLVGMWALNAFDYGFTWAAHEHVDFVELNPFAAPLMSGSWVLVALYKAGMTLVGTLILISLGRYAVAERACWFLLIVYAYVSVRWYVYFHTVAEDAVPSGVVALLM